MTLNTPLVLGRTSGHLRRCLLGATAGLLAYLLVLTPRSAQATIMVDVPMDDMIQESDLVIRGTVMRTGTRLARAAGELEPRTHTWIRVQEVFAGQPPASNIVHVWEPGGTYQDVQVTVAGAPHYEVAEEVVVFLARDPEQPDVYRTVEMTQGKYHVLPKSTSSASVMAVRDLSDVAMARWRRNRMQIVETPPQKPVSIENVKARVRARWLPAALKHKDIAR